MKRLIEYVSILAAMSALGGYGSMISMVLAYERLPREMYGWFQAAVLTFFGGLVLCFVMWALDAWYDRVQSRRKRSMWDGRERRINGRQVN